MDWIKLERCKECNGFPAVLPKRGKHRIFCDCNGQKSTEYESAEKWNAAQAALKEEV